MSKPTMTYALAMAAGADAANRQMRQNNRTAWNYDDYCLACRVTAELWRDD